MICTGVILQSALNEVMAVDGGPGYYDVEDNGKYAFVSMSHWKQSFSDISMMLSIVVIHYTMVYHSASFLWFSSLSSSSLSSSLSSSSSSLSSL